jgi:hypothetical protein
VDGGGSNSQLAKDALELTVQHWSNLNHNSLLLRPKNSAAALTGTCVVLVWAVQKCPIFKGCNSHPATVNAVSRRLREGKIEIKDLTAVETAAAPLGQTQANLHGAAPSAKSVTGYGMQARRALETIGRAGVFVPCYLLENFADDVKKRQPYSPIPGKWTLTRAVRPVSDGK